MNSNTCLWLSAVGILAGSLLRLMPRNAIIALALNLIPALGWLLGAGGT